MNGFSLYGLLLQMRAHCLQEKCLLQHHKYEIWRENRISNQLLRNLMQKAATGFKDFLLAPRESFLIALFAVEINLLPRAEKTHLTVFYFKTLGGFTDLRAFPPLRQFWTLTLIQHKSCCTQKTRPNKGFWFRFHNLSISRCRTLNLMNS